MTELDKFKRRLIRTIARLMQESQPGEEVWEQLQKETGCDCQLLWQRMKALTMKKLKRLLLADDRVDNIASVARMSVTDWLLFDLVLVNEKLDVIGKETSKELPALDLLFALVQRFGVEHLKEDAALEAWVNLTIQYNSRGRRASPMLLQRRWYQMKQHTRESFYKLWFAYRGNQKNWELVQDKPKDLFQAIAKRYPHVITKPFLEWEEMIEKRFVLASHEFENRMRGNNEASKHDDKPDLVMIEPVIETITVGEESDDESTHNKPSQSIATSNDALERDDEDSLPPFNIAAVKQEPIEDCLSNVKILETTHIPIESTGQGVSEEVDRQMRKEMLVSQIEEDAEIYIADDEEMSSAQIHTEPTTVDEYSNDIEIPDDLIKQKAEEYIKNKKNTSTTVEVLTHKPKDTTTDIQTPLSTTVEVLTHKPKYTTKVCDEVDIIIRKKADDFVRKLDLKKLVSDVVDACGLSSGESNIPSGESNITSGESNIPSGESNIPSGESNITSGENIENAVDTREEPADGVYGIEIIDDGIEYVEDEEYGEYAVDPNDTQSRTTVKTEITQENSNDHTEELNTEKSFEENASIDLKLLMDPVVYTTKLDDMVSFQDIEFDSIDSPDLINSVIIESKPVSAKAVKVQPEIEPVKDIPEPVPEPIKEIIQDSNKDSITFTSKFVDEGDGDDDEDDGAKITEELKVKPTSYLLKKPKHRNYTLIQLCKNPDFNTRLKRLTAGFFSSVRNRQLLCLCKPMTIDLHKAFESKLIDGTLYLKHNINLNSESPIKEKQTYSTVLPSAMPVQSIINKNIDVFSDLMSRQKQLDTVDLTKRSKVINLRDLSEIRRINQQLLTAQVPPMRVGSSPSERLEIYDVGPEVAGDKVVAGSELSQMLHIAGGQDMSSWQTIASGGVSERMPENTRNETGDLLSISSSSRGRGSWRGRGRGRGRGSGPFRGSAREPPKINKPKIPYRSQWEPKKPPSFNRTVWNKPIPSTKLLDDRLLTIDALNRMINKLSNGAGDYSKNSEFLLQNLVDTTPPIDISEEAGKKTPPPEPPPKPKPNPKQKYCCWCKEKVTKFGTKRRTLRQHKQICKEICQCCCRIELANLMTAAKSKMIENAKQKVLETVMKAKKEADLINNAVNSIQVSESPENIMDKNGAVEVLNKAAGSPENNLDKNGAVEVLNKAAGSPENNLDKNGAVEVLNKAAGSPENIIEKNGAVEVLNKAAGSSDSVITESSLAPSQTSECSEAIVLSDDDSNSGVDSNAKITTTVPMEDSIKNTPTPVPKLRVIQEASLKKMSQKCSHGNSTCTSTCLIRGLPMNVSGVTAMENKTQPQDLQPVLRINVTYDPLPSTLTAQNEPLILNNLLSSATNTSPTTIIPTITNLSPAKMTSVTQKEPVILNNFLPITSNSSPTKTTPVIYQTPTIQTIKRAIVIDASSNPVASSQKSSQILYLNNKNMIRKPKESPIFLGKNKILLTTVTFPPELSSHVSAPKPAPLPKVIPPIAVPVGVQLILAATGELSYTVEPGSNLTEEQLSVMPTILAAVQQQINSNQTQIQSENYNNADKVLSVAESIMKSTENQITQDLEVSNAIGSISSNAPGTEESTQALSAAQTEKTNDDGEPIQADNAECVQVKNVENDKSDIVESVQVTNVESNQAELTKGDEIRDIETTEASTEVSETIESVHKDKSESVKTSSLDKKVSEEPVTSDVAIENAHASSSLNSSVGSEIITIEELNNKTSDLEANKAAESNSASAGSRNLLSDLMAMSGISAEDARPQECVLQEEAAFGGTHSFVRHLATAVDSTAVPMTNALSSPLPTPLAPMETTLPLTTSSVENLSTTDIQTPLSQTDIQTPLSETDILTLPALTPITSLAQLKYACEHNGQFFKLDFDTGVVVPINVCIKKSKPKPLSLLRPMPKSVIDLTDDVDANSDETTTDSPVIHVPAAVEPVKPVKLFKSNVNLLKPMLRNLLKRKKIVVNINQVGSVRRRGRPRKQRLQTVGCSDSDSPCEEESKLEPNTEIRNTPLRRSKRARKERIEARIDMVDSDAPMEEEYLVESSDSENDSIKKSSTKLSTTTIPVEKSIDIDDSDDEPLAKKFVRIRKINKNTVAQETTATSSEKSYDKDTNAENFENAKVPTNIPKVQDTTEKAKEPDTPSGSEEPTAPLPTTESANNAEDMDHMNSDDDMDIEDSEMVSFLEDHLNEENETQEDDCILGV